MNTSKIAIIDCFANTPAKLDMLKKCISCFSQKNYHTMIVSHLPVPEEIIKSVNYYVYDYNNTFNDINKTLYWWASYSNYDINVALAPPLFPAKGHQYPIVRAMKSSLSLAAINKYDMFCFTEFDNVFDDSDFEKIDSMFNTLSNTNHDYFTLNSEDNEAYKYTETIFFCGKTKKVLEDLISYFPHEIEDFNAKFTHRYPCSLEHFFYDMLSQNKTYTAINKRFCDYFSAGNKNISSFGDVMSCILADHLGGYYLISSNGNKQSFRHVVKYENEIVHDNTYASHVYPVMKLEKEGKYLAEYYTETGALHKRFEYDYRLDTRNQYDSYGSIKIKP